MDKVMLRGIKRFVRIKTYISMKKPIDVLVWYWYCYRVRDTSYKKRRSYYIHICVYWDIYICIHKTSIYMNVAILCSAKVSGSWGILLRDFLLVMTVTEEPRLHDNYGEWFEYDNVRVFVTGSDEDVPFWSGMCNVYKTNTKHGNRSYNTLKSLSLRFCLRREAGWIVTRAVLSFSWRDTDKRTKGRRYPPSVDRPFENSYKIVLSTLINNTEDK